VLIDGQGVDSDEDETCTSFELFESSLSTLLDDLIDLQPELGKNGEIFDDAIKIASEKKRDKNVRQITKALKFIEGCRESGRSVIIICCTGRFLTGVITACLRKTRHLWKMSSCLEEMRRFSGMSNQINHELYVEII